MGQLLSIHKCVVECTDWASPCVEVEKGTVEKGINTAIGHFAQSQADERNPENTALEEVKAAAAGNTKANPHGTLGALLFSGDKALKKTATLSGGEKMALHWQRC